MKVTKNYSWAFTLVELVMVIVIIGLLAAIIVPKFTSQRDQAGIAATKANLENLRTAVSLYYAQEGQWPSTASLSILTDGTAPSGTIYIREIPKCMTYDPTGSPVAERNLVYDLTAPDNAGGWYWDYSNADYNLHPNLTGSDANGLLFSSY